MKKFPLLLIWLVGLSYAVQAQTKVILYISSNCPTCTANENKMKTSGIPYEVKSIDVATNKTEMQKNVGGTTVPSIYFEQKIGGGGSAASFSGYNCADSFLKSEYAAKAKGGSTTTTTTTTNTNTNTGNNTNNTNTNNTNTNNNNTNAAAGGFTAEEIAQANTAKNTNYLTEEEKKTILMMNLARLDGKRFYDYYIKEYIRINNEMYTSIDENTNSYMKSLKKDLYAVKGLPMLYPDEQLTKAAVFHADDMGKTGGIGHESSDGTDPFERVMRFAGQRGAMAENCSYGFNTGLGIVGQLLHDDDTPSLGHRKTILSADYSKVGVAIRPHAQYGYNCVQDFAD
ncbi:MAG: hypothetical protein EAZ55_06840 [Cytophagales bacterium]|nr:MAG: hypothetical protein EAZ55_06840 [Cytophagales bacterium]